MRQIDASGDATQYAYDAAGNMLSLTDAVGNTTAWVYDALGRVVEETNQLGYSRYYAYDGVGDLVQYTDRNGRVTDYAYDGLHRLVEERWLDGQTVVRTIAYAYDAAGQLVAVDDAEADYVYAYDDLGRVTSSSLDLAGLGQTVALAYAYDTAGRLAQLSAAIGGTDDFVNTYAYDSAGRLTTVQQSGVTGGNAVAEKRVDFAYDAFGRYSTITRYADLAATQLVAGTTYTYDSAGRLTDLLHAQGETTLAGYTWTYDSAGRITQYTSLWDGTVDYTYDATGQLTGADYDTQTDESYAYDENGNRTGGGYVVGANNQLLSDGTYWYDYDPEGNRTLRYVWTDADSDGEVDEGERSQITEYEWDHRNRLVRVTERESETGPATQVVEHTYDYLNRWVARAVDSDGDGALGFEDTYFVYDGTPGDVSLDRAAVTTAQIGQIVLQFDDDAQGDPQLTHRYLWGAAVDQILADEEVTSLAAPGDVLWPLPDHLGTVRDLAQRDPTTGETTIASHRTFDSFGNLLTQTNPALDHLFAFTGRALDTATGLQNNLNRWYDAETGQWVSEDPIGFAGGDTNLRRYVDNKATIATDPSGLEAWWWAGTKAFCHELFINELYGGTKALLTGKAGRQLGMRCVGIAETQTGKPFTGSASEWARFGRGVAGDLVGVNGIVEGTSAYDISNQQHLDGWDRTQRGAAGIAALAGTAAGGITAAAKYAPKTFPTAARIAGVAARAPTAADPAPASGGGAAPGQGGVGISIRGMIWDPVRGEWGFLMEDGRWIPVQGMPPPGPPGRGGLGPLEPPGPPPSFSPGPPPSLN